MLEAPKQPDWQCTQTNLSRSGSKPGRAAPWRRHRDDVSRIGSMCSEVDGNENPEELVSRLEEDLNIWNVDMMSGRWLTASRLMRWGLFTFPIDTPRRLGRVTRTVWSMGTILHCLCALYCKPTLSPTDIRIPGESITRPKQSVLQALVFHKALHLSHEEVSGILIQAGQVSLG